LCEFDNPRPLNENFEVPSDFQFFNEITHKDIFQDLQNANGGIKVIYGNPGTGKSVYLSKLSKILKEQEIVTIKHHYHINPFETNSFERLNSHRVIEAIKAQFKSSDYKKYIGDLANKNSLNIPLREFISSVAQNLLKDGKSFVIIIDGLDHVIRERDDKELEYFLKEIFYPQKGLWIVFGMQPQVKNEPSLQSIFNKCPENHWIEIKGLDKKAVFHIIKENILHLNLPQDRRIFNDLKNKLYEINKGNPLHLHYILTQLKNRLNNMLVTEHECSNTIPYAANIKEYYTSLWRTIDDNAKSFLLTFISVSFQFTYNQFIECISSFDRPITTISQGFKKVEHLIATDTRSKLRIYHNSFKVFLLDQPEWKQQEKNIKKNVKSWLENSKYENLRWAELRKLEYELGNDKPILEIDRKWL
jgi:archaellum biogenesis ATPase FlaH